MTNQTSIQYISSLLENPGTISDGDQGSISLFRQTYPYFVPMHYLIALESHKKASYTPEMLSAMQPYMGNWILFCDFLDEGSPPTGKLKATETKYTDAVQHEELSVAELVPEIAIAEEVKEEPIAVSATVITEEPVVAEVVEHEEIIQSEATPEKEEVFREPIITPVSAQNYFEAKGEIVSSELPPKAEVMSADTMSEEDKSLMVVMSFSEWLLHFKNSSERQKEETKEQKSLRTMWQKEKLAAALEEENDEIPETVFEMAVNSISKEEGPVTETLAEIYIKQGKYDKAIEMYRKLSLTNPQKNLYFARKIEEALKDKQS